MDDYLKATLNNFEDIEKVNLNIERNYGEYDFFKVGLAYGYPGIALLFNEMFMVTNNLKYYEICNKYLEQTLSILKESPMYSTSLFEGTMGYIFALSACSNNGTNYKIIVSQLLNEYDKIFDERYQIILNEINRGIYSKDQLDLINGLTGELLVLLYTVDVYKVSIHENVDKIIHKIIIVLEKTLIASFKNSNFKKDNILTDLGMSHGISGLINILNAAYLRGFKTKSLYYNLYEAKNFLLSKLTFYHETKVIPNSLSDENQITHRDAWCYGTPGVALVLYNLSKSLKDESLKDLSKNLAKGTIKRSENVQKLISPTICHGYNGINIINKVMGNTEISEIYFNKMIATKKLNLEFLFYDKEILNGKIVKNDGIGLLEGSVGILLGILSKEFFHSDWYKLFCFS
ncbi:lanthionine synthetase C family protein [Staphylococcus agnetis]|uniref:lanthionine synthetase C family protein n=1 Tax=Staphylococcus agnetis TaxID=985762 RepID=UPI000DFE0008|nr:lanthionine synthetase C family protein [Staphylococcus agnetis]MCO4356096.1 lanthionine synthetase C family protein [Staphylococcus agnetis]SUJ98569.1 lanthionine synthetase C-like family protein [Staphylococcus agnetis]